MEKMNENQIVELSVLKVLTEGKLGYFSTYSESGGPRTFQAWYAHNSLKQVVFASRFDRIHSQDIKSDCRISGAITAHTPDGLGEKVLGVSFQGEAFEVAKNELDSYYPVYSAKWPRALELFPADEIANEITPMRLYCINVSRWILFDENSKGGPKHELEMS